nr:abortive infection system antitoxin AbiGi family protein [Mucilaginibacter sp. L294]
MCIRDRYGSYGIGLTREWGQANGLNPLFYVDKKSNVGTSYYEAFVELLYGQKKKITELSTIDSKLLDVFRYMKNYEADLIRNEDITHDYKFADEKEWRFVPVKKDANYMVIKKNSYLKAKDNANNLLSALRLQFEPKDIKYIIIKHESEISEFINVVRDSKGKKYTLNDVERLMTRIITVEQIQTDF